MKLHLRTIDFQVANLLLVSKKIDGFFNPWTNGLEAANLRISLVDILRWFWEAHDPTQGMGQGNDRGTQQLGFNDSYLLTKWDPKKNICK